MASECEPELASESSSCLWSLCLRVASVGVRRGSRLELRATSVGPIQLLMWAFLLLVSPVAAFQATPVQAPQAPCRRHPQVCAQYSGDTTRGLENLDGEQRKAFVAFTQDEDFSTVSLISAESGGGDWDAVRSKYQSLSQLTDDQLRDTLESYINTPPTLTEVLFKTPVGPVVFLNIILAVTGFSWCDTPFADKSTAACIQLAQRATGN